MKVATNRSYGDPSVITFVDMPQPTLTDDEILVSIHYSSVNRTDAGFLRAKPFVTRFFSGLIKPKYISLGCEFSGIVMEVGDSVTHFRPGDRVFGFDDVNFGGYAEYKTIKEGQAVAKIPSEDISLKEAAVATEGAHYALFYMYAFPKAKNLRVFVNGATGAIGSAAVQLIKAMGHRVEASSTTKELATVAKLGADTVIDWQNQNIADVASPCDVYFDAVGKSSYKEARKIIKPGGMYMSSELGRFGQNLVLSIINPLQKIFTKTSIKFPIPKTRKQEIITIAKHLEAGEFKPLIDKQYAIEDIAEAFQYVESGNKVGNVVVKVKR